MGFIEIGTKRSIFNTNFTRMQDFLLQFISLHPSIHPINLPDTKITPYNVGSVLRRLFSTAEAIQYCGGCSVLLGDSISTVEG